MTSLYQQALPFTGVVFLFPIAIFYSPCSPSNDPPVLTELPEGCSHHLPALALLALLLPPALFQHQMPTSISPTSALGLLRYSKYQCFLSSTPITSSEVCLRNTAFIASPLRDVWSHALSAINNLHGGPRGNFECYSVVLVADGTLHAEGGPSFTAVLLVLLLTTEEKTHRQTYALFTVPSS